MIALPAIILVAEPLQLVGDRLHGARGIAEAVLHLLHQDRDLVAMLTDSLAAGIDEVAEFVQRALDAGGSARGRIKPSDDALDVAGAELLVVRVEFRDDQHQNGAKSPWAVMLEDSCEFDAYHGSAPRARRAPCGVKRPQAAPGPRIIRARVLHGRGHHLAEPGIRHRGRGEVAMQDRESEGEANAGHDVASGRMSRSSSGPSAAAAAAARVRASCASAISVEAFACCAAPRSR